LEVEKDSQLVDTPMPAMLVSVLPKWRNAAVPALARTGIRVRSSCDNLAKIILI
jgi:hypothetical protein